MKNVMIFLFGMLIASAWWGIGLLIYFDMTVQSMFAPLFAFTFIPSVISLGYILIKVGQCVYVSWND